MTAIATDQAAAARDGQWEQRLDAYGQRARDAAAAMRQFDQEQVDRIVWAMTVASRR